MGERGDFGNGDNKIGNVAKKIRSTISNYTGNAAKTLKSTVDTHKDDVARTVKDTVDNYKGGGTMGVIVAATGVIAQNAADQKKEKSWNCERGSSDMHQRRPQLVAILYPIDAKITSGFQAVVFKKTLIKPFDGL